jgi:hypothetical protein
LHCCCHNLICIAIVYMYLRKNKWLKRVAARILFSQVNWALLSSTYKHMYMTWSAEVAGIKFQSRSQNVEIFKITGKCLSHLTPPDISPRVMRPPQGSDDSQ